MQEHAAELAARVDDSIVAEIRKLGVSIPDHEERTAGKIRKWNLERGKLEQVRQSVPSVADAEDEWQAAKRGQERVARLDRTLELTIGFLREAQERVYRDIVPTLRSTLLEWLPKVTADRYNQCRINPNTLQVSVAGLGIDWRDAQDLSHGTAEQIYLLLRLALSRHLGDPVESCPLILDDPLASSDMVRKRAVLEVLHAMSASVQVILFTHEDNVRDWARDHLSGTRDRLIELCGKRN